MAANRDITFGVCSWVLDRKGVTAVARARQLGFEAIEIDVFSLESYHEMCDPAVQAAYAKAAATHGIKLVSLGLGIFSRVVAVHDEAQEALVWEILRHMIDAAVAMKMEYIYCVMARGFGINNANEMAQASEMLRGGCEYIGDRPLQLATESELSIAGNRELIAQVNHPNIRILLDSYNGIPSGAYNAAEMVYELQDVLCNVVHAKDCLRQQSAAVLLGQGDGDFRATVQALRKIGFEGYVMNENSYGEEIESRTAADLAMLMDMFA